MMKSALLIVIVMSSLCLAQKCGKNPSLKLRHNSIAILRICHREWNKGMGYEKIFLYRGKFKILNPKWLPLFWNNRSHGWNWRTNWSWRWYEINNYIKDSIGRIRGLKAYRSFESGAWLNDFIFLEQNKTDVDVFYYLGYVELQY